MSQSRSQRLPLLPEPPLKHVVIDTTGGLNPDSPDADQPGGPPSGWTPLAGHSGIVVAEDEEDGVRYWTNSRSGADWMAMRHAQPWGDTVTEFSYRFATGAHPRRDGSTESRATVPAAFGQSAALH